VHDLYATVCGLAGVTSPKGNDSQDLGPVMRGEKEKGNNFVFLPFQGHQRAVRYKNWKLHVYPKINHRMLFDLEKDPHEMTNLAEEEGHPVADMMFKIMKRVSQDFGDRYPLDVENPQPKAAVYDNAKRSMDVWQPKWIRDKYFGGREEADHGPGKKR
jgi:arylsulfatase A-like enzyme